MEKIIHEKRYMSKWLCIIFYKKRLLQKRSYIGKDICHNDAA